MSKEEKLIKLKEYLKELGSVAVAYSSGVDSSFLLKVAHDVLGDKCVAVTARGAWFPSREGIEAEEFCKKEGIRQIFVPIKDSDIPGFKENPVNRCYICKTAIFSGLKNLAKEEGLAYVVDGSNMDDLGDYRPGLQALEELEIKSPLREVELYKQEIRDLSEDLGLPTFNKPSFACLASRFVYGETISLEKLEMVEKAEDYLLSLGFKQFRVRIHGLLARIEVLEEDIAKFFEEDFRKDINEKFLSYGFDYVTVDLGGFKSGNMNKHVKK